jgi:hypothetical protein
MKYVISGVGYTAFGQLLIKKSKEFILTAKGKPAEEGM